MLPTRFNDAFERLLMAFNRYYAIPRRPENLSKLGVARGQLETARHEVAEARRFVVLAARPSLGPVTADEALRIWAAQQRGM